MAIEITDVCVGSYVNVLNTSGVDVFGHAKAVVGVEQIGYGGFVFIQSESENAAVTKRNAEHIEHVPLSSVVLLALGFTQNGNEYQKGGIYVDDDGSGNFTIRGLGFVEPHVHNLQLVFKFLEPNPLYEEPTLATS